MRPAILGAFFVAAGTLHFVKPDAYAAIVPDALPGKREIVYASGVAEIAGGLGVLAPRTRRGAAWWLIATLVAVFPANVNMAVTPTASTACPSRCCGCACRCRPR